MSRTKVLSVLCLLLMPAVLLFGVFVLGDRSYYAVSLAVVLLALVPLFLHLEKECLRARELTVLAVLTALCVAGNAMFFMLPQIKPSAAIVILTGAFLGKYSGFAVGALSAFLSNFLFGQGPWTPWQMLALGLIGLLAGILPKRIGRGGLCAFGATAVFLIYGTLLNTSSWLMMTGAATAESFLFVQLTGVWFNGVFAAATAVFLFLLYKQMREKTDRLYKKYDLHLT